MLFLAQVESKSSEAVATTELSRFGFKETQLSPGRPIAVETLNAPDMRTFQKNYEEALTNGASVVWYPNGVPHPAA